MSWLKFTDHWWSSVLLWLFALVLAVSWGGILYVIGTKPPPHRTPVERSAR